MLCGGATYDLVFSQDFLAFTLRMRKTSIRRPSEEGFATSHRLKWGTLLPNDAVKIAQHVTAGEGRKSGKGGEGIDTENLRCIYFSQRMSNNVIAV